MLQIIRKGDKTTHGGSILTASDTMKFGGIGVARKGDKVLMNPLMILVKIIKLRWIHILSYDQMV
ncbi:PAAR domain-containing protein, partial [Enterobacter hormaechei]|uniref:PAAR domain-containing protein n=1 Tax=Enterobacter hormaechei TaxID=158836 RepID=UPI001F20CDC1